MWGRRKKTQNFRISSLLFCGCLQFCRAPKYFIFQLPLACLLPPMIPLYFKCLRGSVDRGSEGGWSPCAHPKRGFCLSTSPLCSLLLHLSSLSPLHTAQLLLEELSDPPAQLFVCLRCRQAFVHCGLIISRSFSLSLSDSASIPLIHPEPLPPPPSALSSYLSYILCTHKPNKLLRSLLFAAIVRWLQFQSLGLAVRRGEKREERRSVGGRKRTWEQMVRLNTTCRCRRKAHLPEPLLPGSVGQNIEGQIYKENALC